MDRNIRVNDLPSRRNGTCPYCGSAMISRSDANGESWRCMECDYLERLDEDTGDRSRVIMKRDLFDV